MVATPPPMATPFDPWQPSADPTRVMPQRTLAWVIDALVFLGAMIGLYAALAEYTPVGGLGDLACDLLTQTQPDRVNGCLVIGDRAYFLSEDDVGLQTLASFGYFVCFVVLQGALGASPGKLLMGLRVVKADGTRAGVGRSLGRTLAWAVDGAPWILPLVGPIVGATSVGHRRIGDMAAGTFVIRRRDMGRPIVVDAAAPPVGQSAWGAAAPPVTSPPPLAGTDWSDDDRVTTPWTPSPQPAPSPAPSLDPAHLADLGTPAEPEPAAAEPADIATPDVEADPEWSRTPELRLDDEVTAPADPGLGGMDLSLPDVVDPTAGWVPPGAAVDDPPPTSATEPEPAAAPAPAPEPPAPAAQAPGSEPETVRHELPPPQWDPVRNAYLQWDPNHQHWLQWDDARQRWKPIDT